MSEPQITTTEAVYEDGNRATTIYQDGVPVVIVTMGDGEHELLYLGSVQAAINALKEMPEPDLELDSDWEEVDDRD